MYNNPYMPYGRQNFDERIDNQIAQLQQMKEQFKQQPSINQTFQLAPNSNGIRYVNTIDDVNREMIYVDTPFFSKDMTILWIKNAKGNIKTYELNEIIPKDDKDIMITNLQFQIEELRKEIKNAKSNDDVINEPVEDEKSANVSNVRKNAKKQ